MLKGREKTVKGRGPFLRQGLASDAPDFVLLLSPFISLTYNDGPVECCELDTTHNVTPDSSLVLLSLKELRDPEPNLPLTPLHLDMEKENGVLDPEDTGHESVGIGCRIKKKDLELEGKYIRNLSFVICQIFDLQNF